MSVVIGDHNLLIGCCCDIVVNSPKYTLRNILEMMDEKYVDEDDDEIKLYEAQYFLKYLTLKSSLPVGFVSDTFQRFQSVHEIEICELFSNFII